MQEICMRKLIYQLRTKSLFIIMVKTALINNYKVLVPNTFTAVGGRYQTCHHLGKEITFEKHLCSHFITWSHENARGA